MATFDNRTVYHSALTRLCDEAEGGTVVIAFIGQRRASKFQGRPDYVGFMVEGDQETYQYNIENAAIAEVIDALPRNEWIEVRAAGSHEAAILELSDAGEDGPPPPSARPAARPAVRPAPARPAAPAARPQPNGNAHPAPRAAAPRQAAAPSASPPRPVLPPMQSVMWDCLEAAGEVAELLLGTHPYALNDEAAVDMTLRLAASFWIAKERNPGWPIQWTEPPVSLEPPAPVPAGADGDDDLPF